MAAEDFPIKRADLYPGRRLPAIPETCPLHGRPLFVAPLGGMSLLCGICLEPTCDTCSEPFPFCTCERETCE